MGNLHVTVERRHLGRWCSETAWHSGLVLADAGPNARPGRGAPIAVILWRHRVQSTVLRSW